MLLIASLGLIARDLLLSLAVTIGLVNALGGMVALSLVVLSKLVVVVLMFAALRPGMPALAALRVDDAPAPARGARRGGTLLAVTAAAILPFFAYYAAWGFMSDTVREYSRLALDRTPLGEMATFFDVLGSRGVVVSIALCWTVRWGAKRMAGRSRSPAWRLLVVAADASWIFIGLYAIGVWKNDLVEWLGAGAVLANASLAVVGNAHAAGGFVPVEFRPVGIVEQAQGLFFYLLLPLIWLVMGALINGYELSVATPALMGRVPLGRRWSKWAGDFASHYIGRYRSRYGPVWACLRLTLGAGIGALAVYVVAYRAIGWAAAWAWYGTMRIAAPYEMEVWQLAAAVLAVFFGSPSDLDGGILVDAFRIALVAGMLEYAVGPGQARSPVTATAG